MEVNSINSQTGFIQTQQANNNDLGQKQFLQLLVAQMTNQDPINPMNGAEFASQLAQFNSVEQLIGVNSGVEKLHASQDLMSANLTNSMAASLTGKQVRAISSQVHVSSGEDTNIKFKLSNEADEVEIIIKSNNGTEIRKEVLNGRSSGDQDWTWDGLSSSGERIPEGDYTVEINAKNGDNQVSALTFIEGIASKVRFSGNGVYVSINDVEVSIGDIEQVGIDIF